MFSRGIERDQWHDMYNFIYITFKVISYAKFNWITQMYEIFSSALGETRNLNLIFLFSLKITELDFMK